MFNKRILSVILCIVLLASSSMCYAATFSDVKNDPTVAWAVPYITEMSELGYIKGYEDGTFKPNNTISKTEALILLSRMIGVNDSNFADSVELAEAEYSSVLSKYSTNYRKEVSFLLYTGILKTSELDNYISSANKNSALKRYEAAVLLTKLLGAEEEVSTNAFVSSSYADTLEIPDSARAYVEYVKEMGIMQGMGNNDQGAPLFSPNTNVTRSQMAKMLCSLIDVIDLSVKTGTVVSSDSFNETITVTVDGKDTVYSVSSSVKYKLNGKDAGASDIKRGMHIKFTQIAGKAALIENLVTVEDSVVYGLVVSTSEANSSKTVTIADANDNKKRETYVLTDDAKIRISGAIDVFGKIKANNYVALTLEDGMVTVLEVVDKTTTAYGKMTAIDFDEESTVITIEDNDGKIKDYETSNEEVQVTRNGKTVTLADLMIGDTLSLRMTYGKVTKVQASSANSSNSGIIDYITFSKAGTVLGVEINGEVKEYKVNKSVKVIIDSTEGATVYDLRPGTDIEIGLQSSEIVRIEAAATVAKSQLTGIVKSVNTTYGLIVVEDNGVEYNVFVNGSTKIIDSVTGRNLLIKGVEKNRTASVTGSNSSGVLEASVIVLQ